MRLLLRILTAIALLTAAVTVVLVENSVHIAPALRPAPAASLADRIARATDSTWQPIEISAPDGIPLRAWLFRPGRPNGSAVVLLHGVADTRAGMMGPAQFLLERGYTVLAPDSRGHGVSGGSLIAYGLKETADLDSWLDWLCLQPGVKRLYGLGVSMGAAVLLESLPREARLRAVVADCPFAAFPEVARDRLHQLTGAPSLVTGPMVALGIFYGRLRYGMDLAQASPAAAVQATTVPILLIHGVLDSNIPVRHSRELRARNSAIQLWEVPGAEHVASFGTAPEEYASRVLAWFAAHP